MEAQGRLNGIAAVKAVISETATAAFVLTVAIPLLVVYATGRAVLSLGLPRRPARSKNVPKAEAERAGSGNVISLEKSRRSEIFLTLVGIVLFSVIAQGCALTLDWDKKREWDESTEVFDSDKTDEEADSEETELPPSCASYEKSCEVEGVLTCIDPDTDKANCGGCGITCSDTQICAQGMCACPSGKSACGEACYDFLTEVVACGGCGNACAYANAGASCEIGECQMGACLEGFHDCNGDPSDGCESELKDLENCGACGIVCEYSNAVASCDGGMCEFLDCEVGFDDCDDDTANGCEADLQSDAGNCGGCGTVCGVADPMLRGCEGGICVCSCGNGRIDFPGEEKFCPEDYEYLPTCGDTFCDARNGETKENCEDDCTFPDGLLCGAGSCPANSPINYSSCSDCNNVTSAQGKDLDGDGDLCDFRQNCLNSPGDCGACMDDCP